jgi:uncharacterized membrane protein YhfC
MASRASLTTRRRQPQRQPRRQQPTTPAQCVAWTLTASGIELLILGHVLANRGMKVTVWYVKRQPLQQPLPLQQQLQLRPQRQLKTHAPCARWTRNVNGTEQLTNGLVHVTRGMLETACHAKRQQQPQLQLRPRQLHRTHVENVAWMPIATGIEKPTNGCASAKMAMMATE